MEKGNEAQYSESEKECSESDKGNNQEERNIRKESLNANLLESQKDTRDSIPIGVQSKPPERSTEIKGSRKIPIKKKVLFFLKKWGILATIIFFVFRIYFKFSEQKANHLAKESNFSCEAIGFEIKAVISEDSLKRMKFNFANPFYRQFNDSVALFYQLVAYDNDFLHPVQLKSTDFLIPDIERSLSENQYEGEFKIAKKIRLILSFVNFGQTPQKDTKLEVYIWMSNNWKLGTSEQSDRLKEIPPTKRMKMEVDAIYHIDFALPEKIYLKIVQDYKTVFGDQKHKSDIWVFRTTDPGIYDISDAKFQEEIAKTLKETNKKH